MPIRFGVSLALCLLVLVRIDARRQPADGVLADVDRQVLEVVLGDNRMRAPVLDLTWPMCGERVQSPCCHPCVLERHQKLLRLVPIAFMPVLS